MSAGRREQKPSPHRRSDGRGCPETLHSVANTPSDQRNILFGEYRQSVEIQINHQARAPFVELGSSRTAVAIIDRRQIKHVHLSERSSRRGFHLVLSCARAPDGQICVYIIQKAVALNQHAFRFYSRQLALDPVFDFTLSNYRLV